jgi:hypothetical protein
MLLTCIRRMTSGQPKEGQLAKQKTEEYKLSPKDYGEILKQVELEDIMLEECSAKARKDRLTKPATVSIKQSMSYEKQGENLVLITSNYELIASSGLKKDFALKILCLFKLRYSSSSPLTDDFLGIFTERNVPMQTWPYFREFVQSMTQRMNIPPLTIPLLK